MKAITAKLVFLLRHDDLALAMAKKMTTMHSMKDNLLKNETPLTRSIYTVNCGRACPDVTTSKPASCCNSLVVLTRSATKGMHGKIHAFVLVMFRKVLGGVLLAGLKMERMSRRRWKLRVVIRLFLASQTPTKPAACHVARLHKKINLTWSFCLVSSSSEVLMRPKSVSRTKQMACRALQPAQPSYPLYTMGFPKTLRYTIIMSNPFAICTCKAGLETPIATIARDSGMARSNSTTICSFVSETTVSGSRKRALMNGNHDFRPAKQVYHESTVRHAKSRRKPRGLSRARRLTGGRRRRRRRAGAQPLVLGDSLIDNSQTLNLPIRDAAATSSNKKARSMDEEVDTRPQKKTRIPVSSGEKKKKKKLIRKSSVKHRAATKKRSIVFDPALGGTKRPNCKRRQEHINIDPEDTTFESEHERKLENAKQKNELDEELKPRKRMRWMLIGDPDLGELNSHTRHAFELMLTPGEGTYPLLINKYLALATKECAGVTASNSKFFFGDLRFFEQRVAADQDKRRAFENLIKKGLESPEQLIFVLVDEERIEYDYTEEGHASLLVIDKTRKWQNLFVYLDSGSPDEDVPLRGLINKTVANAEGESKFIYAETPVQDEDNGDCGVFTCGFAAAYAQAFRWADPNKKVERVVVGHGHGHSTERLGYQLRSHVYQSLTRGKVASGHGMVLHFI